MGIDSKKKNKVALIKTIQIKKGNTPCYQTEVSSCDQTDCCWRDDCLTC